LQKKNAKHFYEMSFLTKQGDDSARKKINRFKIVLVEDRYEETKLQLKRKSLSS